MVIFVPLYTTQYNVIEFWWRELFMRSLWYLAIILVKYRFQRCFSRLDVGNFAFWFWITHLKPRSKRRFGFSAVEIRPESCFGYASIRYECIKLELNIWFHPKELFDYIIILNTKTPIAIVILYFILLYVFVECIAWLCNIDWEILSKPKYTQDDRMSDCDTSLLKFQ